MTARVEMGMDLSDKRRLFNIRNLLQMFVNGFGFKITAITAGGKLPLNNEILASILQMPAVRF